MAQMFELASLVVHVVTFLVVLGLGALFTRAARRLTRLERPQTRAKFVVSYTRKVFAFELINNFAPILYAALVRGRNLEMPAHQTWLQARVHLFPMMFNLKFEP